MCSNLQAGGEVVTVASYGCLKVGECIVNHVEVHVIQTALMPCRSVIGGLTKGFVERSFGPFGSIHAHVAGGELREGVRVVRCLLKHVFEFLCSRVPFAKVHVSVPFSNTSDGELRRKVQQGLSVIKGFASVVQSHVNRTAVQPGTDVR